MLAVEGLEASWPGFSLCLDLRLGRGEILAVLGPSGCGKSTLLRLISGLARPARGRILVDGRDLSPLPPERRGIGMVFQDFALFPHMSVRKNIEYGPRMGGLGRSERRAAAEAVAAAFEITPLLERSPYSLSGGEQQRVALARTLATSPSIVLLDEPLSSLDAGLRRRLRAEIAGRLRSSGIAAILVTHDAEEALAVADRICLMREGRVVAEGPPELLYAAPPTAWCASFLGRGPLLEVLSMEASGSGLTAHTALGPFRCARRSGTPPGEAASLFFPAEAPIIVAGGEAEASAPNRLAGRIASSAFAGRYRRVSLECPVVAGPGRGGSIVLDLDLPAAFRPAPGMVLELRVPEGLCQALP